LKKVKIALIIASCVFSYVLGAKLGKKVVKETEIVEVEKVVIQENVRTVIQERPDGSKTTIIEQVKTTQAQKENTLKSKETVNEKTWSVWAAMGSRLDDWKSGPSYRIGLDRRLIGDLWAGAYVSTDNEVGIKLTFDF